MQTKSRKKVFSLGIYVEGLRRLRLSGIIAAVILALGAVIIPVGTVVSNLRTLEYGGKIICESVTAAQIHPLLVTSFFIIAPLLAWIMFSFLNKRNASDFFHSLPHTRVSIFLSSAAAVLTWLVFIIALTSGLSALMTVIFPKHLSLVSGTMVPYMIGCFAASVLVVAAVALAITVTGRPFSNFTVAMLILFFPRFLITMVTTAVSSRLPIVSGSLFGATNFEGFNIIYSICLGFLGLYRYSVFSPLMEIGPQIYTLVLGVVYLAVGCLLFHFRKSETAEHSAPNRILQAVYRIAACMTVCSVICAVCFSEGMDVELFPVIVGYVFAVVVYFLYEVFTTRSFKNLVRAIPGLAVVALLNVAMFGAMFGIYKNEIGFTPSANEIKSVSITADDVYLDYYMTEFRDYAAMVAGSADITDEEARQAVADALLDNVKQLERASDQYSYFNHYSGYMSNYVRRTFKIKTGRSVKSRSIYLTSAQYDAIVNALQNAKSYSDAYLTIPEAQPGSLYHDNGSLRQEDIQNIYETLKKEVSSLSFDTWYKKLMGGYYGEQLDYLYFTTVYNKEVYNICVPLFPDILPETAKAYVNALGKTEDAYLKDLDGIDLKNTSVYNVRAFIWDSETERYACAYLNDTVYYRENSESSVVTETVSKDYESMFLRILPEISDNGKIAYGDSFAMFSLETYDKMSDISYGSEYIVKLSEESRDKWESMFESATDKEPEMYS